MKVKVTFLQACALLLSLATGIASASSPTVSAPYVRHVQVLVSVNAKGKVTSAVPAYELRPALNHAIRKSLEKMITSPAMIDGQPSSCQFVVNLAISMKPLGNGTSSTSFSFVSSKPLPFGDWYWVHKDHHQIALTNDRSKGINTSMAMDPMRATVDAHNHAADIQHQAFMKQYGPGH